MPQYSFVLSGLVKVKRARASLSLCALVAALWSFPIVIPVFAQTPAVGAKAPDFTLSTPSGKAVRMSSEQRGQRLVLVVLRGYPGYQCPYCVRQVHDFVGHASDFAAKN